MVEKKWRIADSCLTGEESGNSGRRTDSKCRQAGRREGKPIKKANKVGQFQAEGERQTQLDHCQTCKQADRQVGRQASGKANRYRKQTKQVSWRQRLKGRQNYITVKHVNRQTGRHGKTGHQVTAQAGREAGTQQGDGEVQAGRQAGMRRATKLITAALLQVADPFCESPAQDSTWEC